MTAKYILDGTTPVLEPDLVTWGRWFETANRHVVETWLTPEVRVSTVFLGLDHQVGDGPPLLFETMIFGGESDGEQWRWSTWHQAKDGHKAVVAAVQMLLGEGP